MLKTYFVALSRPLKRMFSLGVDSLILLLTVWIAFYLRLDTPQLPYGTQWLAYILALFLALPIFIRFGLYRAIFRYSGFAAFGAIAKSVALYGVLYALTLHLLKIKNVPRSIGIIQPLLVLVMIGGCRAFVRFWLSENRHSKQHIYSPRVLIYGAGAAGRQLAVAINHSKEMCICGFLDDNPQLQQHTINGITVYNPSSINQLIEQCDITDILLALPSVSQIRRKEILHTLQQLKVHVRTLPGLMDLANGRIKTSILRELDIEDLLGRDSISPNPDLLTRNIADKVLLVTGAGGSIGSELCRQILLLNPSTLILVDHNEYGLYAIHQELTKKSNKNSTLIVPILASVRDYSQICRIFDRWHPHTVYHAAAYKHVPLVEENPAEGIRNNVWGTLTTARAAIENKVTNFVLISTDKAVRPTNIMGASKRLAELVLQALAQETSVSFLDFHSLSTTKPEILNSTSNQIHATSSPNQTRFSMVRFGNVLGSSGSVVPLFRQQIKEGGPVTLTHPEVTRFFMTIPEAAQLVIQAGAMATGGDVFVLDMGESVKIADLARRMVELSGMTVKDDAHPGGDIEIIETGLRPGEKLYEELLIGDNPQPTSHPRIMKAHEVFIEWKTFKEHLKTLEHILEQNNADTLSIFLKSVVNGYNPSAITSEQDRILYTTQQVSSHKFELSAVR